MHSFDMVQSVFSKSHGCYNININQHYGIHTMITYDKGDGEDNTQSITSILDIW